MTRFPDGFHPRVVSWFETRIGAPTDVQFGAWPKIAQGHHVLITAPTGSGKTLTAFLWALNRLITGEYLQNQTGILYVSPLKALNNDIKRNLLTPLRQLRRHFQDSGETIPDIQVAVRSGDTPQSERRRMLRRPPEILITTPESLNILLSSRTGRNLLSGIQTVIMDEIHSIMDTRRGTHLVTAVDRLTALAGGVSTDRSVSNGEAHGACRTVCLRVHLVRSIVQPDVHPRDPSR